MYKKARMSKLKHIVKELEHHIPFTALGTLTGIVIMIVMILFPLPLVISDVIFHTLHPLHILLSAFVTTSMYIIHKGKVWLSPLIGFIAAIGICSLSDIIIPHIGALLFGVEVEWHWCVTEHPHIIIPSAIIGIIVSYLKPTTKCPHAAHVLISTWASLFYLLAFGIISWFLLPAIFLILFVAVWLPCCTSDIIFPLLFVKRQTYQKKKLHRSFLYIF